jgi:hypothetical protein
MADGNINGRLVLCLLKVVTDRNVCLLFVGELYYGQGFQPFSM